jgi:dihydroxyacetone kinase-like predicted kinase
MSFNFEADFETNCKTMTNAINSVQTAEITTAVRSVQIAGLYVREGDYIGVINGHLAVASQDMDHVARDTLQRMQIENYEIVTLYYGQDTTAQQAKEMAREIQNRYPQLEIEVVDGGQPYYAYILSVE